MNRHARLWLLATMIVATALVGCSDPSSTDPSCNGCVQDGVCVTGEANDACGVGGAECTLCTDGNVCGGGACIAPPACDPTTCEGCCDSSGVCQVGTEVAACGDGGGACAPCAGGEVCNGGACQAPGFCADCDGCCNDFGDCLSGNDDAACGDGGAACEACGGADICQVGACVDPVAPCGPSTCANGCCDDTGVCRQGESESSCGIGGEACAACPGAGSVCSGQQCITVPLCDSSNCDGCCDNEGNCLEGKDFYYCGQGGESCGNCLDGNCSTGICTDPCDAGNCNDGCCNSSNACVDYYLENSCGGGGGETCDTCASDENCRVNEALPYTNASCIPSSCSDTCGGCCIGDVCMDGLADEQCGFRGQECAPCGATYVCAEFGPGGVCEAVDPEALWDLVIVSATVRATNDGSAWDPFSGLPDPYVSVECGFDFLESSYVSNTTAPTWNEVLFTRPHGSLCGDFEIYDSDTGFDDRIDYLSGGAYLYNVYDGQPHVLHFQRGSTLTIRLQPH